VDKSTSHHINQHSASPKKGAIDMTPQQRKSKFIANGESIGTWADKHGFRRPDVYRVLNGQSPGLRGKPHQIAVKLGIKPDPSKTTA
jgi:gp16 family phage-associated protein